MYEKLTGNAAPKGNDELRHSQEIPYRSSLIHYSNSNTVCKLSNLYTVFCRFVEILFLLRKKLSDLAIFSNSVITSPIGT